MNWGHKIVMTFIVFAAIIISMVVISMRQDVSLVAADYYKQELAYTEQMNKLENTIDSLKIVKSTKINRVNGQEIVEECDNFPSARNS